MKFCSVNYFYFIFCLAPACLIISLHAGAQNTTSLPGKFYIEASVQGGKIIRHTTPFPEINRHSIIAELNLSEQTNGRKLWQQLYNRPAIGIALSYGYFGDEKILGHAVGILPNISFRKQKDKTGFFWRLASGIAYLNKPYNIFDNSMNNVIGSKINNITMMRFGVEWNLKKMFLQSSFSLVHYSNGRGKLPNLGYNIPSLCLTGRFPFAAGRNSGVTDSIIPAFKKIHIGGELEYGFYQLKTSRGPQYAVYGGEIFVAKDFSLKNRVFAGVEYVFDEGVYDLLVTTENFPGKQKINSSRISCFLAHEFLVGHIGLLTQAGIFLNSPFLLQHRFPTKLGVRYYLFNPYYKKRNQVYVGFYLVAHSFEADYVGFGAGYFF